VIAVWSRRALFFLNIPFSGAGMKGIVDRS
jgi:hypothetical protein